MIKIIDCGTGNVSALLNCFNELNIQAGRALVPEDLEIATHIILPGVGSFDQVINKINKSGFSDALKLHVQIKRKPLLGICVGMQILADSSEEGLLNGLNFIPGEIRKFSRPQSEDFYPLPHMGWNKVKFQNETQLCSSIPLNNEFYFLHSYFFNCVDNEHCSA